ncbi:TPA: HAD family hydrolase [Streptococcus suis]|nr:HAD family hydrolase [Streptococcus suis]
MIEWIFFDLGSTLLDEEAAYGYYIDKCVKKLESLDIEVSSDSYKKKMVEYAHKSLDPIRATWHYFAPTEPRPFIILSEEVGLSKPNTAIFTLALQKTNIPADRVVYVGDRYDNDILPAKSLGMWTVRILTGFGKHASENEKLKSDWVIPSLQEITNIFEQTKN